MKKRYILSSVAMLSIAVLILAACAAPAAPPAQPTAMPQATAAPAQPTAAPAQPTVAPAATTATTAENVTLRYALWDSNQQPAYQACADAFTKLHPNITVAIEQAGWGQYWDGIATGFVSGTAPDVFTDHISKYPEFLAKNQLVDIQPYVDRDKVDTKMYVGGLADIWVKDGKRYGLPKDWDTIAIFYNADMLKAAGIDPAVMKEWTWNPKDGGTFQETIAKLTLDANGKNALDPAFDKTKIVQYGWVEGPGDPGTGGQTEWSSFAASTGFKLTDGPWTAVWHYDDPRVAETVQWWADQHLVNNYAPGSDALAGSDNKAIFQAKKAALTTDGSWQIGNLTTNSTFPVGIGQLPKGPEGIKTPINGLSDAIWAGTKHPDEAWEWVKFLASPDCANIVGDFGVVFPAIQSGVDKALAQHKSKGVDVSAFTDEATLPNATFLLPMTDHGSEIANLVGPVLQDIFDGKSKAADVLPKLNQDITALFNAQ